MTTIKGGHINFKFDAPLLTGVICEIESLVELKIQNDGGFFSYGK